MSSIPKDFIVLEEKLKKLAQADSSVEFSLHIREPFNDVIKALNEIKEKLGVITFDNQFYFE